MGEHPHIVATCAESLKSMSGQPPAWIAWAPGRINLIGEHTDYNGGLALPGAIDRWIAVALRPRDDNQVRIHSTDFGGEIQGTVENLGTMDKSWQRFVTGALHTFGRRQPLPSGFDAVFAGDVPLGAGLSSSAALLVAWMNILRSWTEAPIDDLELVRMCQMVEHEYLGVPCGLLDQIASHYAKPGHVLHIDFQEMEVKQIQVGLQNVSWVVLHSGVHRELSKSKYARRVQQCSDGLAILRSRHPHVHHFRDIDAQWLNGPEKWNARLRHVISENARVESAAEAISTGDIADIGRLLIASHNSLRRDYKVSCPELDALVEIAMGQPGCHGARMVGGGFGGCTLNLVDRDQADAFINNVLAQYRAKFDLKPRSFQFSLVGGAQAQRVT